MDSSAPDSPSAPAPESSAASTEKLLPRTAKERRRDENRARWALGERWEAPIAPRSNPQPAPASRARVRVSAPDIPPPADLPPRRTQYDPPTVHDLDYYRQYVHAHPLARFIEFAHDCLKIVDKQGRRVPFKLNSTQRRVIVVIEGLILRGIPPRLVVLKSRQVGISTLVEALLFWSCLVRPDWSTLVIAHNMKSSRILFRMSRNYHRTLPPTMVQKKKIDNVHEIEFDSGSRMQIEVQGDPRGYAAQGVHLSEFAFYEQPENTLVAVMQALPNILWSLGVIESTANGVGNKFHRLWQRAVGLSLDDEVPLDERGWTPVFIPWFEHEEYQIVKGSNVLDPTSDELRLMRTHDVTRAQLKWRRWCISSNLDGDEEKFGQEYPSTDQEAFMLSGRPAFDVRAVEDYTKKIADSVRTGTMAARCEIESDPPGVGAPAIVPYDRGRLRIFTPPIERHTYIVGADPSEGDPGSDHSPLAVLDQQTLDFVATWYGKAPPDVLACHAVDLARYYRNALIINEANNHGILFHETVIQLGYPYLYYRKVSEDSVAGEVTEKPGFLSTRRNREHLFNTLRKYVRMRMGKVPCPHVVAQMQSLVYVEGKADAQSGAEKDLLIACALCLMAHRGDMSAPLEPLPEELVRSVTSEALLYADRDPERAGKIVFDRLGLTMDDCLRLDAQILARDERLKRQGLAGMR